MKSRGFTLWETAVAIVMLTVMTAICLQFFAAQHEQQRELFGQLAATHEAANLLDRIDALEWKDLTPDSAARLQLSAEAQGVLFEPRVETRVDEPSGTPPARRVAVAVRWRPQRGGPERTVQLVAWRYKNP